MTLVNSRFQSSLATATDKLIGAGLRVDKFGFDAAGVSSESSSSSLEETSGDKMLSDKLTVLINDISIAMNRLGYASYRGTVCKKRRARSSPMLTNAMPRRSSTPWQQTSFSRPDWFER